MKKARALANHFCDCQELFYFVSNIRQCGPDKHMQTYMLS